MDRLDWDDLGVLLAIGRAGSLRLAAERMKLSPATASRRLSRLEEHLGEVLVERADDGCTLTAFGTEVAAWARAMEQAANAIDRLRDAQNSDSLTGVVRINLDDWLAPFLAKHLAAFRRRWPNLEIELLVTPRQLSLARREADLAIRKRLPEDGQLRVRRVGSLAYGLFAAPSLLAEHPPPADPAAPWRGLPLVTMEDGFTLGPTARWLRGLASEGSPPIRCSSVASMAAVVAGGAAAGVLPHGLVDPQADLRCLRPRIAELQEELWVVVHEALGGSARLKVVSEYVAELLRREQPALLGELERPVVPLAVRPA